MAKVKEIHVEYFYTKQPKVYESERLTIGFTVDVDIDETEEIADQIAGKCIEIVHRRLGLNKRIEYKKEDGETKYTESQRYSETDESMTIPIIPRRRRI